MSIHVSMPRARVLAAATLLSMTPFGARAELLQFEFSGVIQSTFGTIGATPASAFVGIPFAGHVLFESTTPDVLPGLPDEGVYLPAVPPSAFHAQVGGAVFDAPSLEISIANDSSVFSGADLYTIRSPQAFDYPGLASENVTTFSLDFFDAAGAVFTSGALPLVPPDLSHFADVGESNGFTIQGCNDAHFSGGSCSDLDFVLGGDVTSFTLPEPATGGAAALLALALVAWRSRGPR